MNHQEGTNLPSTPTMGGPNGGLLDFWNICNTKGHSGLHYKFFSSWSLTQTDQTAKGIQLPPLAAYPR
jgi:hypothetical protein